MAVCTSKSNQLRLTLIRQLCGIMLCFGLVSFVASGFALADPYSAEGLSGELPNGWKGASVPDSWQLMFTAQDGGCVIAFTIVDTDGATSQAMAEQVAAKKQNTVEAKLQPDTEAVYYIDTSYQGLMGKMIFFSDHGDNGLIYLQVGDAAKYSDEIKSIWKSLKSESGFQQKILQEITVALESTGHSFVF